jgi:hypothetical protein
MTEDKNTPNRNLGTAIVPPTSDEDLAAIEAAIAQLGASSTTPTAATTSTAAPLAPASDDELEAVEAELARKDELEGARAEVHSIVPPSVRAKMREIRDDFDHRQREYKRKEREFDNRLTAVKLRRRQEQVRRRVQKHRAAKTQPRSSAKRAAPLPVRFDCLHARARPDLLRQLRQWARRSGRKSSALLRGGDARLRELVRFVERYTQWENNCGKPPSDGKMAELMRCSRPRARHMREIILGLFGPTGPWRPERP